MSKARADKPHTIVNLFTQWTTTPTLTLANIWSPVLLNDTDSILLKK